MSKPKTKKDAYLRKQLESLNEAESKGLDPKFAREQRRKIKKKRSKHLRGVAKRELREILKDI